ATSGYRVRPATALRRNARSRDETPPRPTNDCRADTGSCRQIQMFLPVQRHRCKKFMRDMLLVGNAYIPVAAASKPVLPANNAIIRSRAVQIRLTAQYD